MTELVYFYMLSQLSDKVSPLTRGVAIAHYPSNTFFLPFQPFSDRGIVQLIVLLRNEISIAIVDIGMSRSRHGPVEEVRWEVSSELRRPHRWLLMIVNERRVSGIPERQVIDFDSPAMEVDGVCSAQQLAILTELAPILLWAERTVFGPASRD